MSERLVKVDTTALDELTANIDKAKRHMVGRLAERGYQLLRREVPVDTHNLQQGVAPPSMSPSGVQHTTSENLQGETIVDYLALRAELVVSARSGATAGGAAEVFDSKGNKKKVVTLSPQPGYNYAEVVARGNNPEHGPTLSPTHAKAFIIPVASPPEKGGYLMAGGKFFVFRKTRKAMKANPFDQRAADQLSSEARAIGEAVLREFV